jgi:hypothetical protein
LNFYFPASMIGYFDDLAAALRRESVNGEELAGIAASHAMEIVGPPSPARPVVANLLRPIVGEAVCKERERRDSNPRLPA